MIRTVLHERIFGSAENALNYTTLTNFAQRVFGDINEASFDATGMSLAERVFGNITNANEYNFTDNLHTRIFGSLDLDNFSDKSFAQRVFGDEIGIDYYDNTSIHSEIGNLSSRIFGNFSPNQLADFDGANNSFIERVFGNSSLDGYEKFTGAEHESLKATIFGNTANMNKFRGENENLRARVFGTESVLTATEFIGGTSSLLEKVLGDDFYSFERSKSFQKRVFGDVFQGSFDGVSKGLAEKIFGNDHTDFSGDSDESLKATIFGEMSNMGKFRGQDKNLRARVFGDEDVLTTNEFIGGADSLVEKVFGNDYDEFTGASHESFKASVFGETLSGTTFQGPEKSLRMRIFGNDYNSFTGAEHENLKATIFGDIANINKFRGANENLRARVFGAESILSGTEFIGGIDSLCEKILGDDHYSFERSKSFQKRVLEMSFKAVLME